MLSTFLAQIHLRLQKFAFGKKRIVAFLERFDTAWLRLSAKVAGGALAHGKSKNVQRIFCGHTQEALSLSRDDVEYYNTGSWTQESATYVAIDHQGVRIYEYQSRDPLHYDFGDGVEFDFDNLARVQSSE
jgi:UDP-2,3-diacylglucosamine pyrophosphatase LpxH